ncbi:protein NO VEIN domain-containing protein [Terasakiella brassicae]|nr:DUF3883 domain-containing protein [Terasakiella brassicae]
MSSQKMVLFRLQWMEDYKGFENIDKPTFEHLFDGSDPHEAFNFQVENDGCHYGFARISKGDSIHIERLGEVDQDDKGHQYVDGVTVIWTAKHPSGGMVVVGWYRNARVYRDEQYCPDEINRPFKGDAWYRVSANAGDVFFLETELRDKELLKGLGDTWKQARPFYISEKKKFSKMERKLWKLAQGKTGVSVSKKRKKPVINQERKKEVEEGAIKLVTDEFEKRHYTVESFEDRNVGYDLQAISQDGQEILCIEVKGHGIDTVTADFTFNEYDAITEHQKSQFNQGEYVICIVTSVSRPGMKLHEFRYDKKRKGWFDNINGLKLDPEERVAVKFTAKRGRK